MNAGIDDYDPEGSGDPSTDESPSTPSKDSSHADDYPSIARLFVVQVLVWNLVILLGSLGTMLIYFEDAWTLGGQLVGAGLVLALYGIYRWPNLG